MIFKKPGLFEKTVPANFWNDPDSYGLSLFSATSNIYFQICEAILHQGDFSLTVENDL
jgi:hypothetical protein